MDLDDFLRHKQTLERKQRDYERAQGRLESTLQRLQKEYGCATLGAAKKLLAKKIKTLGVLATECQKLLTECNTEYQEKLAS